MIADRFRNENYKVSITKRSLVVESTQIKTVFRQSDQYKRFRHGLGLLGSLKMLQPWASSHLDIWHAIQNDQIQMRSSFLPLLAS